MSAADTAQIIAAIAGSVSAVGTLAAATAAMRTARLSSATTRRNNQTLARESRPDLSVWFPKIDQEQLGDPIRLTVEVGNIGSVHTARNIEVIALGAGKRVVLDTIDKLAPTKDATLMAPPLPVPAMPPPARYGPGIGATVLRVQLRFQDDSETVTWRQEAAHLQAETAFDEGEPHRQEGNPYLALARFGPREPIEVPDEEPTRSYWRTLGQALLNRR